MNPRGMHLSFEALFSLLVLVMLISVPLNAGRENLEDIYVLQKQHDLVKIWVHERDFGEGTLRTDFEFVFPGRAGSIRIGEREIEIGGMQSRFGEKSVALAHFLDSNLEPVELQLTVFR